LQQGRAADADMALMVIHKKIELLMRSLPI